MMTKENGGFDEYLRLCQAREDGIESARLGTRPGETRVALYESDLKARRALRIALLVALFNFVALCIWVWLALM